MNIYSFSAPKTRLLAGKEAEEALSELASASPRLARLIETDSTLLEQARNVLPASRFVMRSLQGLEELFIAHLNRTGTLNCPDSHHLSKAFSEAAAPGRPLQEVERELRRLRRFVAATVAWQDLSGRMEVTKVLEAMTHLAETAIESALSHTISLTASSRIAGAARLPAESTLCVIGMGKLGGCELNFSSDVDLIFCFEPTPGLSGHNANEIYTRVARGLLALLSKNTADGFVFRTDTRLRPFGDSGPLVLSQEAYEEYYETHGRQWERYALVKARPVAGNLSTGTGLLEALRPFVYRRYLDYSTIESLRRIKTMIEEEMASPDLADNVKLGPGGIREVEFIVQTFQLIKGGRLPGLRGQALMEALEAIGDLGLLPRSSTQALAEAYIFLRAVENRIQEYDDQQSHVIPKALERRQIMAWSLGFDDWTGLEGQLRVHRDRVHEIFSSLFSDSGTSQAVSTPGEKVPEEALARKIWLSWRDGEGLEAASLMGFKDPAGLEKTIWAFRESRAVRSASEQAIRLLDSIVPRALAMAAKGPRPDKAVQGLFQILEAVMRRTSYLSLLKEYPQALSTLLNLCGKARMIASMLAKQPILLDELVDPIRLTAPMSKKDLAIQMEQLFSSIPEDDHERRLDELRLFKKANLLRAAACELEGLIDSDQASKRLTDIAEVILERCLKEAARDTTSRACKGQEHMEALLTGALVGKGGLSVIALGKAGSREMGYGSDLDLIFVHDSEQSGAEFPKEELGYLLTRLVHRLIHYLTTRTSQGILYDIDTRLRPDGAQGVLVSSLPTFMEYQYTKAWTWEHQALIRARFVAGSESTGEAFCRGRQQIIAMKRDPEELRRQVVEMRRKMARVKEGHGGSAGGLHLKNGCGTIIDIEFMVQYLTLAHAFETRELARHQSTSRLIEVLKSSGLLKSSDADLLSEGFRRFRAELAKKTLDQAPPLTNDPPLLELAEEIHGLWHRLMGEQD